MQKHHDFLGKCLKLSRASNNNRSIAFERFNWPETLPHDIWWMPREQITVYETSIYKNLSETMLVDLSRREMVNQFSLSIHNERVLINEVLVQISRGTLPEEANDYLHHFVEEENQHMWYFNKFCKRYFGRIYGMKATSLKQELKDSLQQFMVFARIYIFEAVGDFYNRRAAECEYSDEFVRKINRAHVEEEARHISFGKSVIEELFKKIAQTSATEEIKLLEHLVRSYINIMIESMYNAAVYRESGIDDVIQLRSKLIAENEESGKHRIISKDAEDLFCSIGLFN